MLTEEQNERLTKVGPGTPMGELLRRYWQPVAAVCELEDEPVIAVRILGEDLVLYRDGGGRLGLLDSVCAHRKVSLVYGVPENEGLRCCYHGWLYDNRGNCIEQPAEPEASRFKEHIHQRAYPVQKMGGLVWAYMGPSPEPLLPRYDVLVWEDAWRDIGRVALPCNWLQCMENSFDLTHVDYLHGRYFDYVLERQGKPPRPKQTLPFGGVKQVEMTFQICDWGMTKQRRLDGSDEWEESSNPIIFPNMTRAFGRGAMQMRVPIDDTHTLSYLYMCYRPDDGRPVAPQESIPLYDVPLYDDKGRLLADWVTGQDFMAWITQGPLMDRSTEQIGRSDQGITIFRDLLEEQLHLVQDGKDPLGILRDPENNVFIPLAKEDGPIAPERFNSNRWQRFSPFMEQAKSLMLRHLEEA